MIKKTCIIKSIVVSFLFYIIILIALNVRKLNYKDFKQIYLFKVVFIGILIYLFYMKRLSKDILRHLKVSADKSFRNEIKRKTRVYHHAKYKRPQSAGIPSGSSKKIYFEQLRAPSVFNLQYENCESVIQYISRIKELGRDGKNLAIRMDDIIEIGEGAISMLLSVLDEFSKGGTLIRGTKPKDQYAKNVLERSGFFNFMSGKIDEQNKETKNTILRTGGEGVTDRKSTRMNSSHLVISYAVY